MKKFIEKYEIMTYLKITFLMIITFILLQTFVITKSRIVSGSMEPTLNTGSIILVEKISRIFTDIKRGDIVEFKENNECIMKRVIGVAGDEIAIKDGFVYLNGKKLEEDYLAPNTITTEGILKTYVVPENSLFLLGDNRMASYDSRYWENPYILEKEVKGKYFITLKN